MLVKGGSYMYICVCIHIVEIYMYIYIYMSDSSERLLCSMENSTEAVCVYLFVYVIIYVNYVC